MRFLSQHLASLDHPKDDSCAMKYTISRLLICSTDSVATIVHEIICSTILIETLAFGQLTQPITRLNRLKKGVNFEKRPGGAHRVHFEHSLLHDSVTTTSQKPSLGIERKLAQTQTMALVCYLTGVGGLEKRISRKVRDYSRLNMMYIGREVDHKLDHQGTHLNQGLKNQRAHLAKGTKNSPLTITINPTCYGGHSKYVYIKAFVWSGDVENLK